MAVFVAVVISSIVIHAPETVTCPFTLVPVGGTDPVRAPCDGFVSEIRLAETQAVEAGQTLFVLRSDLSGERASELEGLELALAGARKGMTNLQERYASLRRADEDDMQRLEARSKALTRKIEGTRKVQAMDEESEREAIAIATKEVESLTNELEYRNKVQAVAVHAAKQGAKLLQSHAVSDLENLRIQLEADRARLEVHKTERELAQAQLRLGQLQTQHQGHVTERSLLMDQLDNDRSENETAMAKLRHQHQAVEREFAEQQRALEETIARHTIRVAALKKQLDHSRGNQVVVAAPCAGSVVRMRIKAPGAFVKTSEVLCELAGKGERLEAELAVPATGIGRIGPAQRVKMYYDAFPYQRYGVKYGTLRWISPAGSETDSHGFRALGSFDGHSFLVDGQERQVRAGMTGKAEVVVGKRSLISYAFEPLRQLRESLADQPARGN
jgi:multidrug efflux pump subunit AcrA (membrane-fusion protein)